MRATTAHAGQVLSIGVFFSLMLAGLAPNLPQSLEAGLLAEHVPPAVAHQVAATPPVSSVLDLVAAAASWRGGELVVPDAGQAALAAAGRA